MRLLCDVMVDVSLDKCTLNWRAAPSSFPSTFVLPHVILASLFSVSARAPVGWPRCDITAVLLYVEHLMWSVCENPAALVHSNPYSGIALIAGGSDWPYQIHSLCDQLLTVLVIVTSPLSLLYR